MSQEKEMPRVVMYCTPSCPYCLRAEVLLTKKGVTIEKLDVDANPGLWDEVYEKTDRDTVPQIFIDGKHIGGFDDLAELEVMDELDELLQD